MGIVQPSIRLSICMRPCTSSAKLKLMLLVLRECGRGRLFCFSVEGKHLPGYSKQGYPDKFTAPYCTFCIVILQKSLREHREKRWEAKISKRQANRNDAHSFIVRGHPIAGMSLASILQ